MRMSLSRLAALGLSAAVVVAAGAFVAPSPGDKAKLGEEAPGFTLPDASGKEVSLKDFAGHSVVIEWINPRCPYIQGVYEKGIVKNTIEKLRSIDEDIVYLTINTTADRSKEDIIKETESFLKQHKIDVPMLFDYDGTVGKMYGARTTPHMFVIDAEGVLRYHGEYTDDPHFRKGTDATNRVLVAVQQIADGETVAPDYVKPWGCSVKYNKKQAASE